MEIEKKLNENEVIVSATNNRGDIIYANAEFVKISEYSKTELYGNPHNIVRHPDMPKAIFKHIWSQLLSQKPVVAYIKNYTKDHDKYYWVKALLCPVVENGNIIQLTSYRTKPMDSTIEQIKQVYRLISDYERSNGVDQSLSFFYNYLKDRKLTYESFINKLSAGEQVLNSKLLTIDINQFKVDHILFRSRIESLDAQGEKNIEVTQPTCCAFGKQLALFDNESFASDDRFSKIKQVHNRVHQEMQTFVDAPLTQKDLIITEVHKDIDTLFETMDDLIKHYK
jgi:PAS domain S-box-containing protein